MNQPKLLLLLLTGLLVVSAAKAQVGTLMVELKNISSAKGNLMLALFQKSTGFPSDHKQAFKLEKVPAQKGIVSIAIDKLPFGQYALAVYHDENADGRLNTNTLGIPKEGYAFSNNVRPLFSAPKFSEAAFDFKASKKLQLDIRY